MKREKKWLGLWKNGATYEGDWQMDLKHGKGKSFINADILISVIINMVKEMKRVYTHITIWNYIRGRIQKL